MRTAFLGIALAALVTAPARADVFAVAPLVAAGHADTDIALIDVNTDARVALPAGINTAAGEDHPSVSSDGRRIAFERRSAGAGTDRIVAADVVTGQTLDLFDAFQAATLRPTAPAIRADGTFVTTGSANQGLFTRFLDEFPDRVSSVGSRAVFPGDPILDPTPTSVLGQGTIAYRRMVPVSTGGSVGQVLVENALGDFNSNRPLVVRAAPFHSAHPAMSGKTLVYDVHAVGRDGTIGQGDISFCLLGVVASGDPCVLGRGVLPPLVSSLRNEACPAFTPDGRYLGFIRDEANGHQRLYVFDTQTQTLLDANGADLGTGVSLDTCSVGLYTQVLLKLAVLPVPGTLKLEVTDPTRVGLLVQRVTGHHKLLGRRVPTLKPAGRIPLGAFRRGKHTVHWRARGLKPGRYQFTPRALTAAGRVRDLGTPRIFRIG